MTRPNSDIELWLIDLTASAPLLEALERDAPRLSNDDRQRAGRFADPVERRQRAAAYVALRIVLERVAGFGSGRQPLVRSPAGKPSLAGSRAQFSLSHTEGFALIGAAARRRIGVDLERTRPLQMLPYRRDQLYAVGAGLGSDCLAAPGNDGALIQAWVRLEAFSKARGRTLGQSLADLGMRGRARRPAAPAHLEAAARRLAHEEGLAVFDMELPPGLQGAVAVAPDTRIPTHRPFPADAAGLARLFAPHRRGRGAEPGLSA